MRERSLIRRIIQVNYLKKILLGKRINKFVFLLFVLFVQVGLPGIALSQSIKNSGAEIVMAGEYEDSGKKIIDESRKLQSFLFTYVLPVVALAAGAYGIINAFLSSSLMPIVTYGGISLACILMPHIIGMIKTASSVLIPF